ncbi:MAG: META domain-containing protein [Chloroflexi bacterium]|nr:META domain-containing protein [Chloroflexota bacterium]
MKMKLRFIFPAMALLFLGACAAVEPENNGPDALPETPAEKDVETEIPMPSEPESEPAYTGILKTIWIGPELKDCTGVAPQKCMQIKWEQDADWGLFYNQITGFTFEPGYEYELIVEERQVENPPADAPSLAWHLVEITSKTPQQEGEDTAAFGSTQWMLVDMGQSLLSTTQIMITFNLEEMQISGNSGCNSFFGGFTLDEGQIGFGPMGSTRMACETNIMDQEFFFLNLLAQTSEYQILGDQLKLITSDGQSLIFMAAEKE